MRKKRTRSFPVMLLLVSMVMTLLAPLSLNAQEARGTISGKVMDADKARLPDATVKITNVAMGTTTSR